MAIDVSKGVSEGHSLFNIMRGWFNVWGSFSRLVLFLFLFSTYFWLWTNEARTSCRDFRDG
jgi:hypothetical protein